MLARLAAGGSVKKRLYPEDVFLCNTRIGTGGATSVAGGPDIATFGGMVHIKNRFNTGGTYTASHNIFDTAMGMLAGGSPRLLTENTDPIAGTTNYVISTSSGFNLGVNAAGAMVNAAGNSYVDYIWRNAKDFFQVLKVTKSAGSNLVIDLSPYMAVVGAVTVKSLASGSWYKWHRSLPAGQLLIGETTAAATALGHITVVGTTLTLVDGVIANGDYHIECYAHDTGADWIIKCGSFTTDASGNATVDCGGEVQYVQWKDVAAGYCGVFDTARGMPSGGVNGARLFQNSSDAEDAYGSTFPTATGFQTIGGGIHTSATHIYIVVRRPCKPPTSGAQVFNAQQWTGNDTARKITGVCLPPDLAFIRDKSSATGYGFVVQDRLRGAGNELQTWNTSAEGTGLTACLSSFDMDGVSLGTDSPNHGYNKSSNPEIGLFFRRAPGVLDIVCDKGTGAAHPVAHNLESVPELAIRKARNAVAHWVCYAAPLGNSARIVLSSEGAVSTEDALTWNATSPTSSAFTVGTARVNDPDVDYFTILFATLPGISKVSKFTKVAGVSLNVDCGFTTGSRFLLAKSTGTGPWYLWDSVRGIVAGSDPYLLLNSAAAEVTNTDWIDPYALGFTVPDGGLPAGEYVYVSIS